MIILIKVYIYIVYVSNEHGFNTTLSELKHNKNDNNNDNVDAKLNKFKFNVIDTKPQQRNNKTATFENKFFIFCQKHGLSTGMSDLFDCMLYPYIYIYMSDNILCSDLDTIAIDYIQNMQKYVDIYQKRNIFNVILHK